ncbi:CHAT domain-containing protein [Mycena epipterygia]|nr:CHAT domain-containing protein [Mycena epipterygia]
MELAAGFSLSQAWIGQSGLNEIQIPTDQMSSSDRHLIKSGLQKLYLASFRDSELPMDPLDLWIMHERILFLSDPNKNRAACLNTIGNIYSQYYEKTQSIDALNQAVCAYGDAVRDNRGSAAYISDLGVALVQRFERRGDLNDIEHSILMNRQSVKLTPDIHPKKHARVINLGASLLRRFERLGDLGDIEESVVMFKTALGLISDDNPEKAPLLNNLGGALLLRFQRFGKMNDLDQTVMLYRQAVTLTPDGDPNKPTRMNNLGNSLLLRFGRLGDLGDINECVVLFKKAVELVPQGHLEQPRLLINLSTSLQTRFEQFGDLGDINEAVTGFKEGVKITPDGHPNKPMMLANLAGSLKTRFQRLGNLEDINESVILHKKIAKIVPDSDPHKPGQLTSLSTSLRQRFDRLGDVDDIDESILVSKEAVKLTPKGHPDKPGLLINLGISLSSRFQRFGDVRDINESVLVSKEAAKLIPDGHPDKPLMLTNFGNSFVYRFQRLQAPEDYGQLLIQYSSAACSKSGPALVRFQASCMWAHHAQMLQHTSTLNAYTVALDLLPELAWLALSISDRHHQLLKAEIVVRDAGAAAIAAGEYGKAVEWLEQGRSVIWGQFLDLRSPLGVLKQKYPNMADALTSLSIQLEGAAIREKSPESMQNSIRQSNQIVAERYHDQAHKRDELLKKIRSLDGFERFLLPKPISDLSHAARRGPVVILNLSINSCDALVLMPGLAEGVMHIPLTNFTIEDAGTWAESLGALVNPGGRSERLGIKREGYVPPEARFAHILSELWWKVVKPVLDALAITNPSRDNPQRMWWCPTGPLAFLPIHAAGVYGENEAFGSKLSDFVISSYTPSLTALIQGFRAGTESQDEVQLLAVAQPSADGQSHIPGTQEELDHIQRLAKGKVPILRLEGTSASVKNVQQGMKKSRWVHFACHGVQNIANPTQSALLLAGSSHLTLSNIIQLSLPNADLAFLSACQTATGAKDLQEEAVHLAAGMLLAGYRGVIATMWSIMDDDAPQVAADVYEHLFETSPPDPTRAAEALHLAVRKLREGSGGKKSFFHWVPFIHIGV